MEARTELQEKKPALTMEEMNAMVDRRFAELEEKLAAFSYGKLKGNCLVSEMFMNLRIAGIEITVLLIHFIHKNYSGKTQLIAVLP